MSEHQPQTAAEVLQGRKMDSIPRHERLQIRVRCCIDETGEGLGEVHSLRHELNAAEAEYNKLDPVLKLYLAPGSPLEKDPDTREMGKDHIKLGKAIVAAREFFQTRGITR